MLNKKYKILIFLLITFLWAWISWFIALGYTPNGIDEKTLPQFLRFFFIGVYAPAIGAILTTLFFDGFSQTITLLKKIFIWKFSILNYLLVIFLPILFVAVAIGLYVPIEGKTGHFDSSGFHAIPAILWAGLWAGPLGEELGWRGFLLPELQKKFSSIKSATVIGIIWFFWHTPLFFAPIGSLISGIPFSIIPFLTFLLMVISMSWIMTWLVNNSNGSVLISILFHLSINACLLLAFFPELQPDFKKVNLLSAIPMILFALYLGVKTKLNTKTKTPPEKIRER